MFKIIEINHHIYAFQIGKVRGTAVNKTIETTNTMSHSTQLHDTIKIYKDTELLLTLHFDWFDLVNIMNKKSDKFGTMFVHGCVCAAHFSSQSTSEIMAVYIYIHT